MVYIELTLSILGIILAVYLLAVLYRLYQVLGELLWITKRLRSHRNFIKETLNQLQAFCHRYSKLPENEEE